MPLTQVQGQMLSGSNNTTTTIQSNGTTAITIDSSQNVGIGISPNAATKLQVKVATNQDLGVIASSFVTGGVGLAAVNDAYNALTPLDLQGTSIQMGTGGTERMRINSSGYVLVGTTGVIGNSQLSVLALSGRAGVTVEQAQAGDYCFKSVAFNNGGAYYYHFFVAGTTFTGQITSNGTTTAYATTSDYRLKENVAPMTNALSVVQQLKPVTYKWKLNGSSGQGFLAHELQEVCPDAVTGEKDAVDAEGKPVYQSVDTSFLVATLTAAIQELKAELDATKAEVAELKAKGQ